MWSLLHRNQESVLVGTAVALVMLALLAHGRVVMQGGEAPLETSVASLAENSAIPKAAVFTSVPSDPAYYAAKWRQIANDFYAAHPVHDSEPAASDSGVVTASQAEDLAGEADLAIQSRTTPVVPVSHSHPSLVEKSASDLSLREGKSNTVQAQSHISQAQSFSPQEPSDSSQLKSSQTKPKRVPVAGFPAVAAAMAAGLLAFLGYRMLWASGAGVASSTIACVVPADRSDSLRIELPSRWVRMRPTFRQRAKPIVLAASYVAGGLATWMIML